MTESTRLEKRVIEGRHSCLPRPPLSLLYFVREASCGRTAREPGQVRKEAAVGSLVWVACLASHFWWPALPIAHPQTRIVA